MLSIDASVFISAIHGKEPFSQKSQEFLKRIRVEGTIILLPEIIITEITSGLFRATQNQELVEEVIMNLKATPNFSFIPIDRSLSDLTIKIILQTGLKSSDALYVALAFRYHLILVTLDKEQFLKGKKIIITEKP